MNGSRSDNAAAMVLRIDPKTHSAIAKVAERECRTMASVIRQAIKEFLEKRPAK